MFLLVVKSNLLEMSRSNLIFTKIFICIYLQEYILYYFIASYKKYVAFPKT